MSYEVTLLGVQCQFACSYCYQNELRDAGNFKTPSYDLEVVKAALRKQKQKFTIFGGEPLLVPLDDLIELFELGMELHKSNGVQTNGALITPAHIEAFKQYNVHAGFSLDGPGELNRHRWAGSEEKTRVATAKSQANLEACLAAGVRSSLILTLHRHNASPPALPHIKQWLRGLIDKGLRSCRLHLLEVDHDMVAKHLMLTDEENIAALADLHAFEKTVKINFDIFTDVRNLQRTTDSKATCIWNACDPLTTRAVQGLNGEGTAMNCGRAHKDGIPFIKGDPPGFERYLALYNTPQEYGGCQGCRFFAMCKGQCPGTGLDTDWRNRSDRCGVWKWAFGAVEEEMLARDELPFSMSGRRVQIEERMVTGWAQGVHWSAEGIKQELFPAPGTKRTTAQRVNTDREHWDGPNYHGDHYDGCEDPNKTCGDCGKPKKPQGNVGHGDKPHQDIPHGDSDHGDNSGHGDHYDNETAEKRHAFQLEVKGK